MRGGDRVVTYPSVFAAEIAAAWDASCFPYGRRGSMFRQKKPRFLDASIFHDTKCPLVRDTSGELTSTSMCTTAGGLGGPSGAAPTKPEVQFGFILEVSGALPFDMCVCARACVRACVRVYIGSVTSVLAHVSIKFAMVECIA